VEDFSADFILESYFKCQTVVLGIFILLVGLDQIYYLGTNRKPVYCLLSS
jgi:hypothetical protein